MICDSVKLIGRLSTDIARCIDLRMAENSSSDKYDVEAETWWFYQNEYKQKGFTHIFSKHNDEIKQIFEIL